MSCNTFIKYVKDIKLVLGRELTKEEVKLAMSNYLKSIQFEKVVKEIEQ